MLTTPAMPVSESLSDLLTPLLPTAYRVALHLTRKPADAEDVVQEAALNACRSFDTFVPGTNFRAWFLRIVTNVFFSRCRKTTRAGVMVSLDAPAVTDVVAASAADRTSEPDALGALISRLDTNEILAALGELPVEYRAVSVLYFSDDLPYREIATVVGCPVGTVRSRLHRARTHLKRRLAELAAERGLCGAAA